MTPPEHGKGPAARAFEARTDKVPSGPFLWLAGGSIAASLTMKLMCHGRTAPFVGQRAATFPLLGLYNKAVTVAGCD